MLRSTLLISCLLLVAVQGFNPWLFFETQEKETSEIFLGEDHAPGFVNIGGDDDMFFWLFGSRNNRTEDPLVIWLTGGPGCSSEMAVFYENGPFKVNDDLTLVKNEFSWNNRANLLFVDQPIGTGYSTGKDYVKNEDEVAADFYKFFLGFLEKFPEFKTRSLVVTGESYAGHYIPAISAYFVKQANADVNLKAAAIGNGWVDPYIQYPEYNTFAKENDLISDFTHSLLTAGFKICQGLIKANLGLVALEECQLGVTAILGLPTSPKFNVYDIRKKCDVPPLCYDFGNLDKFLAREDVQAELGVTGKKWTDCNMVVHMKMLGDWMLNLEPNVETLLENNIQVLVYSGDKDFICNWRGGEAWTNALPTAQKGGFPTMEYTKWEVNGTAYGEYKATGALTFLRVYDAGHMVPMDQPLAAEAMLETFLKNSA